jgi:hypothetical protein
LGVRGGVSSGGKSHDMVDDLYGNRLDMIRWWIKARVSPELTLDPEVNVAVRV